MKKNPAFKRADKWTGLMAIGHSNSLRRATITVWDGKEHRIVGSLSNTHEHALSAPKDADPLWTIWIKKQNGRNVRLKFKDPDLEVVKQFVRDNIEAIWKQFVETEEPNEKEHA